MDETKISFRRIDGRPQRDKGRFGITCAPYESFYADIHTFNSLSQTQIKDFIIAFGKNDPATGSFKTIYSYRLLSQTIPVGSKVTTIQCQATSNGIFDCYGGIGEYINGIFSIEDGILVTDALNIAGISVTNAIISTCSDYLNQSICESNGCFWWNNKCNSLTPSECSQINNNADCNTYGCYWYDDACHHSPQTNTAMTMENANIPIDGSDIARILITDVFNLGVAATYVRYDPNVVSVKSIVLDDIWNTPIGEDDGNGNLTIGGYLRGFTGDVVLAHITFEPAPEASVNDTCSLALVGSQMYEPAPPIIPILHDAIDGTATIIQ